MLNPCLKEHTNLWTIILSLVKYWLSMVPDGYTKGANKYWARLIKKIYEVDPLTCPKCGGSMRIIAFIEDCKVIRKILDWLSIDEFRFI